MTEAQQKQFAREQILGDLEAASPASLPLGTLKQGLRLAGLPLADEQIAKHADYLVGSGLVEQTASAVSAGAVRYKITAAGIDHLEGQGL